jgi:tRNA G10  N-methylase Trm11
MSELTDQEVNEMERNETKMLKRIAELEAELATRSEACGQLQQALSIRDIQLAEEQRKYCEQWQEGEELGQNLQDANNEIYAQEQRAEKAEAQRYGWEKAARECAGHCHDYCLSRIELEAERDWALKACRVFVESVCKHDNSKNRYGFQAEMWNAYDMAKEALDD